MKIQYPIFHAQAGSVISVHSNHTRANSICGYCRALVLENDHFRFIDGFRRYADRSSKVSWAEPVEWAVTPVAEVSIRIVPDQRWMEFVSRSAVESRR